MRGFYVAKMAINHRFFKWW